MNSSSARITHAIVIATNATASIAVYTFIGGRLGDGGCRSVLIGELTDQAAFSRVVTRSPRCTGPREYSLTSTATARSGRTAFTTARPT